MIVIAMVVLTILIGILAVLFFYQEKRQRAFVRKFGEIVERLETAEANCKVLAKNDETLLKDMKMMLHEFKNTEKKVKFNHGR